MYLPWERDTSEGFEDRAFPADWSPTTMIWGSSIPVNRAPWISSIRACSWLCSALIRSRRSLRVSSLFLVS